MTAYDCKVRKHPKSKNRSCNSRTRDMKYLFHRRVVDSIFHFNFCFPIINPKLFPRLGSFFKYETANALRTGSKPCPECFGPGVLALGVCEYVESYFFALFIQCQCCYLALGDSRCIYLLIQTRLNIKCPDQAG